MAKCASEDLSLLANFRIPIVFGFRVIQAAKGQMCPECGGPMVEIDRTRGNGISFVWYECKKSDCDGQWLKKIEKKQKGCEQFSWLALHNL